MFLFSVLFGLSTDYQVFLLSRIRERYTATDDTTEAIRVWRWIERPADHCYSPSLVPKPSDWPPNAVVTGYWQRPGGNEEPDQLTRDPDLRDDFGQPLAVLAAKLIHVEMATAKTENRRPGEGSAFAVEATAELFDCEDYCFAWKAVAELSATGNADPGHPAGVPSLRLGSRRSLLLTEDDDPVDHINA